MFLTNGDKLLRPLCDDTVALTKEYNLRKPSILGTKRRAKNVTKKNNQKSKNEKAAGEYEQNMFSTCRT